MSKRCRYQTELFKTDSKNKRVGDFIEIDCYDNLKTAKIEAEKTLKARKGKHRLVVAILDNNKDEYVWSKKQIRRK